MSFSAVILAGGKSSRMGCDKAFAKLDGWTLLARQIQLARTSGAAEIFISGRPGVDYSVFGSNVLQDKFHDAGPLAGIHRALEVVPSPLLLVLAVDLPAMNANFLQQLAAGCPENAGVVPRVAGCLEPLVAIYPKTALPLATSLLEQNSLSVKIFAERCEQATLISIMDLPDSAAHFFANCNSPGDLKQIQERI